jgi:hypothetical protein
LTLIFGTFGYAEGWRRWSPGELRFMAARAGSWQRMTRAAE